MAIFQHLAIVGRNLGVLFDLHVSLLDSNLESCLLKHHVDGVSV